MTSFASQESIRTQCLTRRTDGRSRPHVSRTASACGARHGLARETDGGRVASSLRVGDDAYEWRQSNARRVANTATTHAALGLLHGWSQSSSTAVAPVHSRRRPRTWRVQSNAQVVAFEFRPIRNHSCRANPRCCRRRRGSPDPVSCPCSEHKKRRRLKVASFQSHNNPQDQNL